MTRSTYLTSSSADTVNNGLRTLAKVALGGLATGFILAAKPAAATDLLVAPTRLVFENRTRSTEVILNNIGSKAATYRVSLVLRRMAPDGQLEEVETPTPAEQRALDMISYAPRRIVLEPSQPQAIRVAVRRPADLPDGEYRVHMMFRAVPDAPSLAEQAERPVDGFAIRLIPIYGITIPIIVRSGSLAAQTEILSPRVETESGQKVIAFDLARHGDRSVYGEVRVLKPGRSEPLVQAKGIAVYTEVDRRTVQLRVGAAPGETLKGPVTIQYLDMEGDGRRLLAEQRLVLN